MPRRGPAAPNLTPTPAQLEAFGLDPAWSRRVSVTDASGRHVDWHVLDTGGGERGTVVCVHGNPSWAYLWRDVLGALAPTWRVVAVDQTNMGYSERTSPRRLSERVDELVGFCREHVAGPLVLVAHDWGGAVAVGASAHLDVAALVLANTAVAKPDGVRVPPLIALARRATSLVCRDTPTFVAGAAAMTARRHRTALLAPYRTRARRAGVAQFVADIPVSPGTPRTRPSRGAPTRSRRSAVRRCCSGAAATRSSTTASCATCVTAPPTRPCSATRAPATTSRSTSPWAR